MTMEQAYSIYAGRYAERATDDTKPLATPRAAEEVELGSIYRSGAVIDPSGEQVDPDRETATQNPREPLTEVGARAPHVTLKRGGDDVHVHDLFSDRFVLLAASDGAAWRDAAASVAARTNVPLDAYQVGGSGELQSADNEFEKAYTLAATGAVIVRPDGVVAWRSTDDGAPDADTQVADAMARLLATV
jgi:hypothetical protein